MCANDTEPSLSEQVGTALPYLRRYARALTGSQASGDHYAAATLEAILDDRDAFGTSEGGPRVALFAMFHGIWDSAGGALHLPHNTSVDAPRARALRHLARLTPRTREALLLQTVEGFTLDEVAQILRISGDEAAELVAIARAEMHDMVRGRVLVIEDEPIIAMEIEAIVTEMGHEVTGIATTRDEAVALGRATPPDVILADIQLADKSSGVDAVNDLGDERPGTPVVFITAFPERLLTGQPNEPAFLIAKPFRPPQVVSALSQAMFFASSAPLRV